MKMCLLLLVAFLLGSCGGYHFVGPKNPFAQYGVKSVAVPMFVNQSVISGVGAPMTREIRLLLQKYNGLEVVSGESKTTDAVLVGVITSGESRYQVFEKRTTKFTSSELAESLGERNQFYVPTNINYRLALRLVLIKRPSAADLEFLSQGLFSPLISRHPQVVMSETLNLSSGFTRYLEGNLNVDDAGVVNYTKTQGVFESNLQKLAKSAAASFETVVIHVF